MASKKKAPTVVKDPTRYVVVTLDEYNRRVKGASCSVRESNGDGLEAAIKAAASYSGESYIVVAEIKRVVKVPTVYLKDIPSLKGVSVEILGDTPAV